MKTLRAIFAAIVLLTAVAATAQPVVLPHQFQAGQPARADDVNSNFEALRQAINRGLNLFFTDPQTVQSPINTGIASVTCPSNTLVLSASCSCSNASNTRNFGVLFGCEVTPIGAIAGCFADAATNNFNLPPPRATVTAQCLGAVQADGTRAPTFPLLKSAEQKTKEATGPDSFASKLNQMQQAEADWRARVGR